MGTVSGNVFCWAIGEAPGARRFLVVISLQSRSRAECGVSGLGRRRCSRGVASSGAVARSDVSVSRRTPALFYALHSQTSFSHAGTHAASVLSPDRCLQTAVQSGERFSKWRAPSSQIVRVVRKPFVQGWTRRAEVRDGAGTGGAAWKWVRGESGGGNSECASNYCVQNPKRARAGQRRLDELQRGTPRLLYDVGRINLAPWGSSKAAIHGGLPSPQPTFLARQTLQYAAL